MTHLRKMMLEELSFLSMLICWHNQKVYGGFLPKNQKVGGSTPLGRATFTKRWFLEIVTVVPRTGMRWDGPNVPGKF